MDYTTIPEDSIIEKTADALKEHSFDPIIVESKEEALDTIKKLIPKGASVMNGASRTLEEVGYVDYLKEGKHGWDNLHEKVFAEKDPAKQSRLRKEATISDFYLGSAHAVTEEGEILIASNTGSQLPGVVFNSPNLILVVGAQKIVPDLKGAFDRLEKQVIPLEDERMKGVYGYGTTHAKTLILHKENPAMGRKVHVVIVKEPLGF